MKKSISLLTYLCLALMFSENISAQLKVFSTGNVGIDVTDPVSRLAVGGIGYSLAKVGIQNTSTANNSRGLYILQARTSGTYAYGMSSSIEAGQTSCVATGIFGTGYRGSTAYSSGQSYGIRGQAGNATAGWNIAVSGELLGSNNGAAIYGAIPGKNGINVGGMYAGYFRGNVKMENDLNVLGVFTNSDINLKKDVKNLDKNNIEKIKQLQAIKYKLKTPIEMGAFTKEVTDTAKVLMSDTELNDPMYKKDYIGFSAQEIQKVYPEIVKVEDNGYLSVNYIALIPVLIEAIKEQQVTIDDLTKKMEALTTKSK
jgi:hypothetical protein